MDSKPLPVRFTLGKQSSLARESSGRDEISGDDSVEEERGIDPRVRLMYLAHEGDLEGIKELLESGTDVNFRDIDDRTALHVAACQGFGDVVEFLLKNGADVDPEDRWGSRPLADAIHYQNHDVIKLLEKHGAQPLMAPMHVKNARQVPEYEIDPKELDFTNSVQITKGTFSIAFWQGTKVAVKRLGKEVTADENKVTAFRDETRIASEDTASKCGPISGCRNSKYSNDDCDRIFTQGPYIFLFMSRVGGLGWGWGEKMGFIVLPINLHSLGDLGDFLKRKGALRTTTAVRFALDIARNILRDDSGHLKVADFGVSKMLKVTSRVKEDRPLTYQDSSCRYVAPEVFRNEEYDTKVDVFSFALILQELVHKGNV
ncbi:integrin-linked protein kinase family [Actinidia rufa]|uniref:Integrin-linked protein kinase family n=1 Tax=Actinidia rufa TaxID=165716 RepID=A0A7J0DTZ6_9ERIC|nr:integrin-linked protein kinase family [Actinidia rufa]